MNTRLILASGSPRRKLLLRQLGLSFNIQVSNIKEKTNKTLPNEIVEDLALKKALEVAKEHQDVIVIGADTIVYHKQNILGKPLDRIHAKKMLLELSNSTHSVYSGVAFVKKGYHRKRLKEHTFSVQTKVTFDSLDTQEIEQYIKSNSPMDKAGAYGIQDDWGAVFVKKIDGDYYNVVGLPLNRFYQEFKKFEPTIFSNFFYEN